MGVRSLCGGLLIALALVCTSIAQAQVSLAGFSASRGEGETIVQLDFTGPAQFQLDRFTMGEWVSIWSNELALPAGVDEIPLEFDRPGLAEYVTGAAMSDNGHRGSIKLYLGQGADRMGVRLEQDSTVLRVCIPDALSAVPFQGETTAPGSFTFPAQPEPFTTELQPMDAGAEFVAEATAGTPADVELETAQEPPAVEFGNEAGFDAPALLDDHEPAADIEPIAVDFAPQAGPEAVELEPQFGPVMPDVPAPVVEDEPALDTASEFKAGAEEPAEVEAIPVQPISGAFAIPRDDIAPPVLPGFVNSAPEADAPFVDSSPAESGPMPSVRQAGPFSGQGEVNFQYIAPTGGADKPAKSDGDDSTGSEDLEKMLEEATEMAKQQLTETQPPAPGNKKGQKFGEPLSTPLDKVINPYDGTAAMSTGASDYTPKSGKAALADIIIDLFEILGTPLDQALTLLIAPTDYNVIIDASVGDNAVSLSFKNGRTDLKSALDMLTKTYGLDYAVQADTIVVASKDKLYGQLIEFEKELFVLDFADPQSVKEILINTALVAENQVEIYKGEATYPEVNDSTTLSGTEEGAVQEVKPLRSNLSSTPRNALLVRATPEDMVKIREVIQKLDRKPSIIELEVQVCEASESALKDLGIDINSAASEPVLTTTTWSEQVNETGIIEDWSSGSYHRSPLAFMASLHTQVQEGKVDILAQPTLSTVDGKQAIYFAGERVPYIAKVQETQNGSTQVEVDYLQVGVTLNFKPRLDSDGKMTIDMNPIVSSLIDFRLVGEFMEAPRTSSREVATTVRVGDCEPFVIAGLIQESDRSTVTKIPFIGDLPLVGKLFRNKNRDGERTEIIIVVTPHIVDN